MRLKIAEWAKSIDISEPTARQRIKNHGIPVVKGTVDPEEAESIWNASRNPRQQERQAGQSESAQSPLGKVQYEREVIKRERELLELRQARQELVPAAEVQQAFAERVSIARALLLGVPAKVALEVANSPNPAKCKAIIDKAIREALVELAEE